MSNTVSDIVSDEELNAIIQIESAGRPTAKAATSSALGLGQFLNATWLGVVNKHRPDLMKGRNQDQVLRLRIEPSIAVELLARFTEDNRKAIGMKCTPGDLYLAHFLGVADARDLFRAAPDTPVSKLVTPQVIAANKSIMSGKSAGQVRAWAARKMAQPPKANWVARYYKGAVINPPLPKPRPDEINPDLDGKKVDAEPPEVTPAPPVERPDPVPPVAPAPDEPKKKEGFGGWAKRQWKGITSWTGGGLGVGGFAYFTDWRVVATLMVGGVAIVLLGYWLWKRSQA